MNSTTPKSSGINYAKLRKQRSNQDTLPKSMSTNIKMNINQTQQFGGIKHRSTSQHNINEMAQIELFDQCLEKQANKNEFLVFLDRQMQYFSQNTPQNYSSFRVTNKAVQEEKKKLQVELQKYNQENAFLIKEIKDLNKTKQMLVKRYDALQSLILKDRLNNQQKVRQITNPKFQHLFNQISPVQETISSLTDERFESNTTSLDSSLSYEDDQSSASQLLDLLQKNSKHRFNFQKQMV
ncbi:unnamed protein product (macronuclear) [Paramecium tetraurelia]|uniref:Uncharacterized protein n=1 Tax=Paramecium tetraurelia TaxID=5888 RepID=A0BH89_PARTE|nr:uncharacterized protein GSPATT00028941001 [Paramecium tetraurelia]CAK57906.1 unnamed protein product [Paramecium tetraurelia]|eukprot:XP_001425304.1 hypothetical protein (macronuclear) [Paramecium tetraurelia strain d4-2]